MRKLHGKILYGIAVWGSSFTQTTVMEFAYKLVHALRFKYCLVINLRRTLTADVGNASSRSKEAKS